MASGIPWRRALFPGLVAAALAGCGDSTAATDGGTTTPHPDVPRVDAGRDGGTAPVDAAMAAPYPAFHPDIPVIADFGGYVMNNPNIRPVFVADAGTTHAFEHELVDFVTRYMASATWLAQVGEYGPGAGTVGDTVHVDAASLPTGTLTASALRTWIQTQVQGGMWGAPAHDDIFVVFLNPGRVVDLGQGNTLCGTTGGYHTDIQDASHQLTSVAVIPNCDNTVPTVTNTLSHELVEAATDPYPDSHPSFLMPSIDTPPDGAWAIALHGGEVGDMCEFRTDNHFTPMDVGYSIQRTWSNMAIMAYTDPCVPVPAGSVYFNSAPVLRDTIQIAEGRGTVNARGVVITTGGSTTIDVHLFSTGPTSGPWRVSALEVPTGTSLPALRFAWDQIMGQNGDTLHLTITARSAVPQGRTFIIRSTLGTTITSWVGAVVTTG